MTIPIKVQDLTAGWLTRALQQGGRLPHGEVRSAECEQIGVGQGFASQMYRVRVRYGGDAGGLPASFIAKLPPAVEFVRQQLASFGVDRREIFFYQQFAPASPLRVPICYWSALHPELGYGALLLEDLQDARVLDQVESCSPGFAADALADIARFHAHWWEHPQPGKCDWLTANLQRGAEHVSTRYGLDSELFMQRHDEWLPPQFRAGMGGIAQLLLREGGRASDINNTLAHGDFRLENMMLERAAGEDRICVIDFQLLRWGRAASDVAYFLGQSLSTDVRRAHEVDLLDGYHRALLDGGVRNYNRADLDADYRRGLLLGTRIPVMGARSMTDMEATARGQGSEAKAAAEQLPGMRRLFSTIARRAVDAILDNDALALLDD